MNRLAVAALVLSLVVSACIPNLGPLSSGNSQATIVALAGTLAAQTVAAQPTPTILPTNPPTATIPPTVTFTSAPPAATVTSTFIPTSQTAAGTTTVTGTLPATGSPSATVSATATATATFGPGTASPTDPMVIRLYGTQPPYIKYGRVRLINQAKAQVYISFQCTTEEGLEAIVEYPVSGTITVSVPAGRCHWVAWVGGREFVGDIGVSRFEEIVFKFKKSEIIIQ